MDSPEVVLFAVGYPAAVAVIARWVPVVRERRWKWLAVHHAGVAAIVAGWLLRRPPAAIPNAAWLVVSSVWYAAGGRVSREAGSRTPA
ncbi:MAG TPA: hypothetical protein VFJ85_00730 [Acidimicrobiales bacterium]|nr:hypothetical protein [Acidimicrobiales bacterium]